MGLAVEFSWEALNESDALARSRFAPARTTFNLCRWVELSDTEQEEMFAHELGHHMRAAFPSAGASRSEHSICESRADRWALLWLVPDALVIEALVAGCRLAYQFARYWGRTLAWALRRLYVFKVQHPDVYRLLRVA